jgi:hypothetical protein
MWKGTTGGSGALKQDVRTLTTVLALLAAQDGARSLRTAKATSRWAASNVAAPAGGHVQEALLRHNAVTAVSGSLMWTQPAKVDASDEALRV